METNKNKTFVSGLFCRMPNDKAPDFVLMEQSFKPHEFFKWCQDNMVEGDQWVNITIKKSQKGTIYGELNTWKPKQVDDETGEVIPDLTKTSPSPEYPNGIELKGHPFVEDKELSLNDIPTELNLEDIPFN